MALPEIIARQIIGRSLGDEATPCAMIEALWQLQSHALSVADLHWIETSFVEFVIDRNVRLVCERNIELMLGESVLRSFMGSEEWPSPVVAALRSAIEFGDREHTLRETVRVAFQQSGDSRALHQVDAVSYLLHDSILRARAAS